jgi:predicted esterase
MTPLEPAIMPDLRGKPIFLAAGRFDSMVPSQNVENLAQIFQRAGADVTLRWENASHGLAKAEIEAAHGFASQKFA